LRYGTHKHFFMNAFSNKVSTAGTAKSQFCIPW
jgi:hypothetical protein